MTLARAAKKASARISRGLHSAFGAGKGGAGVLMYHRVGPADETLEPPTWNVTPARFAEQLEGLLTLGYRFLPAAEIALRLARKESIAPRTTAVTFDDGYACVYTCAFPVLAELRIPATIFLATGFMNASQPFPFDGWGKRNHGQGSDDLWRPLTWDECRIMAATGLVDFGSHSDTHDNFARNTTRFRADIEQSRARLDAAFGPGPRLFAYPGGARSLGLASFAMARAVEATGYAAAFTTDYGSLQAAPHLGRFRFLLPRYEVTGDDDAASISAKLAGWYDWVGTLREVYRLPRRFMGSQFGR